MQSCTLEASWAPCEVPGRPQGPLRKFRDTLPEQLFGDTHSSGIPWPLCQLPVSPQGRLQNQIVTWEARRPINHDTLALPSDYELEEALQ